LADFEHAPHLDRKVSANGAFGSNGMKADRAVQHSQRASFGDDSLHARTTRERTIPSRSGESPA
jgi:hypothetical protein